jgi:hypothetical protein
VLPGAIHTVPARSGSKEAGFQGLRLQFEPDPGTVENGEGTMSMISIIHRYP